MSRTTRRIAGVTVIIVLILNLTMYVFAEERNADDRPTASSYMERGIRAVYHNMNLFYEAYYDDEGKPEKQPAGHTAIEQEWKQDELVSRTYLGRNGQPMNRVDGYSKVVWEKDNSGAPVVRYYDTDGNEVQIDGLNLSKDVKVNADGWSDWFFPKYNVENHIITVGDFNMGDSEEGDVFTLSVTIEFKNVSCDNKASFAFRTAGAVNNIWDNWKDRNPWNFSFINIDQVPADGIYTFTKTIIKTSKMVESSKCNLGFRCDYWNSGEFRIRDLKIERGSTGTIWSPGI